MGSEAWTEARRTAQLNNERSDRQTQHGTRREVRYPKPPRAAAICVSMPRDSQVTVTEAMTTVRRQVDLDQLGVRIWNTKRTLTGGVLIEIRGPEKEEQAKTLASKIEEVLEDTGAKITTPKKTVDIRLHRIEESVTAAEVVATIAQKGCCRA